VHHAYPIADRFSRLNRGRRYGTCKKSEVIPEEVVRMTAGGEEPGALDVFVRGDAAASLAETRQPLAAEVEALEADEAGGGPPQ
jgi:hypothetical protein